MKKPTARNMSSSIFDSFEPTLNDSKVIKSSIFDNFDVSHSKPSSSMSTSVQMESSIFDSYESTVKPKPEQSKDKKKQFTPKISSIQKTPPSNASIDSEVESSIFDSFNISTPSNPKQTKGIKSHSGITSSKSTTSSTNMQSSGGMESSIFQSFNCDTQYKPKLTKNSSSHIENNVSSIFDSYDTPKPVKKMSKSSPNKCDSTFQLEETKIVSDQNAHTTNSGKRLAAEKELNDSIITTIPLPNIWAHWQLNFLLKAVARRLLREMTRIIASFQGDPFFSQTKSYQTHAQSLVPPGAHLVLHNLCNGEAILVSINECLARLCSKCHLDRDLIINHALSLLACPSKPQKIVFAVLLYCVAGRVDLINNLIRSIAHNQMQTCQLFSVSNDDIIYQSKTKNYISSLYVRRQACVVSWQLELCLWLNRGNVFSMSKQALKESIIAVRLGYVITTWGRCHESLENILKLETDFEKDRDRGRQLWSSMKYISTYDENEDKTIQGGTTSGGWEFLVNCERDTARVMLQNKKAGNFLIRPHANDHEKFTLSFRTNLQMVDEDYPSNGVQHAIVRLSESGFKCGTFGPFSSLLKLLEAVSSSLPFELLFNEPPVQGIIKEEGDQPSPNSVLIRKLSLVSQSSGCHTPTDSTETQNTEILEDFEQGKQFGMFSQLLTLSEFLKQFSAIAMIEDDPIPFNRLALLEKQSKPKSEVININLAPLHDDHLYRIVKEAYLLDDDFDKSELVTKASRTIRPLLNWCRSFEAAIVGKIAPNLSIVSCKPKISIPLSVAASEIAVEAVPFELGTGDAIIRRMIQPRSGVDFHTLRVGEGGHSAVVVLFKKSEAATWIANSGVDIDSKEACRKLDVMEKRRIIEQIDLNNLVSGKSMSHEANSDSNDIRYRFVDPWEVEALESKDGELRNASLGREHYESLSIGSVARECEKYQRFLGGSHLHSLWSASRGGVYLTKALSSVHPPWERTGNLGILMPNKVIQSSPYHNSFRKHLYRNALFRRLRLPQRFIALVQVELLDLKNLTAPSGTSSVTAYALLRLKRTASNAPLSQKARPLDSAYTEPKKINKTSGPNAPASWGCLVRFRFPLPEDVDCDGVSLDGDCESLFRVRYF